MDLQIAPVSLGSDPEAFLTKGGLVIGSERVVPDNGIEAQGGGRIVQDGVQIELSLKPSPQRYLVGTGIGFALAALRDRVRTFDGVEVSFDPLVTVEKRELRSLSEKSRVFGCKPTYNFHGLPGAGADPAKYLKRSAGGHIHMGLEPPIFDPTKYEVVGKDESGGEEREYVLDHRKRLVPLLDVFVGNTGVLLDNKLAAIERRKNYGKAGEFRLPAHGLEYRVLSNFWLRSYQLMGLVMGLSKLAVSVLHTTLLTGENLEGEVFERVKFRNVLRAIQTNDLKLAHKNFETVQWFIETYGASLGDECGLNPGLLPKFELFLKGVEEKGLGFWFPENPLDHWIDLAHSGEWGRSSWEEFLRTTVKG